MSRDHVEVVREYTDLKGSALLIMLDLAAHANHEDNLCFPSLKRLAKRSRVSERQTQRIVSKLVNDGYLRRLQQGNGRGNKTIYKLPLKGDISDIKGDSIMSPFIELKGDISGTQRVTLSALKGDISDVKGDIAMSYECIEELHEEQRGNSAGAREPTPPSRPESQSQTLLPQTPTSEKIIRKRKTVRIISPHLKSAEFVDGYIPAGAGTNAVQVYYERFEVNHDRARLNPPQEDDLVRMCPDLARLRDTITAYSRTNYRPGNLQLILDWYGAGVPKRNQNGDGKFVPESIQSLFNIAQKESLNA